MASERASQQAFLGVSGLVFAGSAAATVVWCASMSAMGEMPMPGFLQFTAWKARQLACCREIPGRGRTLPADAGTAWRHGLRLSLSSVSPRPVSASRERRGAVGVGAGLFLVARAAGLG